MCYRWVTMQYNHDKPSRITIELDEAVIKKLRALQSELIKIGTKNVTTSEILEYILREKIKI